jgi:predicted ATPase
LREYEAAYAVCERRHVALGNAKLAVVAGGLVLLWLSVARDSVDVLWLIAPAVAYGGLAIAHELTMRKRRAAQTAAALYRTGIARIEDLWAGSGAPGEEFREAEHVYADDLDLFGRGCLFQLLSTARLPMGEKRLAEWLKYPSTKEEVLERQELVAELRGKLDLHRDLAIAGEALRARIAPEALMEWAEGKPMLPATAWRWLAVVLALAFAIAAALYVENVKSWPLLVGVLAVEGGLWMWLRHRMKEAIAKLDCNAEGLELFSQVLQRLEQESFAGGRLQRVAAQLQNEGQPASAALRRLARVVYWADNRENLMAKMAELPFLYTLQVAFAAEAWKRRWGGRMRSWIDIAGEMEALVSLATYAYEHPEDPFPEFTDATAGGALFDGQELGHPLLAAAQCVRNSVRLDHKTRVLLVSGSNMSGKSTLLRTVGINAVLAMAGAPIRGKSLRLTPLKVGTRIHSMDSLQEGRSNFYTEILHIRQVFALLEAPNRVVHGDGKEEKQMPDAAGRSHSAQTSGTQDDNGGAAGSAEREMGRAGLLFLFDELLEGTNSHDRRIGAEKLLRALVEGGAIGMVTTHDLALTEMGEALGSVSRNVHFEDSVVDGKMKFDYRLREGVVAKSNAIALMRVVGLDV